MIPVNAIVGQNIPSDIKKIDSGGNDRGDMSVNLQPGRASDDSVASGSGAIAIGYGAKASDEYCVSVGTNSNSEYENCIAFGLSTYSLGSNSLSIGTTAFSSGDLSSAVGARAYAEVKYTNNVTGMPVLRAISSDTGNPFNSGYIQDPVLNFTAADFFIGSGEVDFTLDGDKASISIPAGVLIYPEEIKILLTEVDTITAQPTIVFDDAEYDSWSASSVYVSGTFVCPTSGYNNYLYEVTAGGGGSSGSSEPTWPTTEGSTVTDGDLTWTCRNRQIVTPKTLTETEARSITDKFATFEHNRGISALTMTVTSAGSATMMAGRFIVRALCAQNE